MRTYDWDKETQKGYRTWVSADLSELVGKVLTAAYVSNDRGEEIIIFRTADDEYALHHAQDCCETVYIESVVGDIKDLVGEPILVAEQVSNMPDPGAKEDSDDSYTWTFYKFATRKGYVDIRWYGTSSGYYSEDVDFVKKVRR